MAKEKKKIDKTVRKDIRKELEIKRVKEENKTLKTVLIIMSISLLAFFIGYLILNSLAHFEYRGVKFDKIREGQITLYHTSYQINYKGQDMKYNVYLRNDPRKLEEIPFKGYIDLKPVMVINNTNGFVCGGDGGIAMYNFQQILTYFEMEIIKDPNAICDEEKRYSFLQIQESNVTGIEKVGPSCYNLNVNNCEILKVTERFLVEVIVRYHEIINQK